MAPASSLTKNLLTVSNTKQTDDKSPSLAMHLQPCLIGGGEGFFGMYKSLQFIHTPYDFSCRRCTVRG